MESIDKHLLQRHNSLNEDDILNGIERLQVYPFHRRKSISRAMLMFVDYMFVDHLVYSHSNFTRGTNVVMGGVLEKIVS